MKDRQLKGRKEREGSDRQMKVRNRTGAVVKKGICNMVFW